MRLALVCICAVTACGRVGFDELGGGGSTTTDCVVDDFNDGTSGTWSSVEPTWMTLAGVGPDGSTAFGTTDAGGSYRTIASSPLTNLTAARFAVDMYIGDANEGDFIIILMPVGWTTPNELHYQVGIFPPSSDTTPDTIGIRPGGTALGTTPSTVAARTWSHVEVMFNADHSMDVALNGAPYMSSPADTTFTGPFDLLVRFYRTGRIDNVRADCVH